MVFDKIDINGDGEEVSYAMPNSAPTAPTRSSLCHSNSRCWMSHGESWQKATLREGLAPRTLRGLQPAQGDTANCPSSHWQSGGLHGD